MTTPEPMDDELSDDETTDEQLEILDKVFGQFDYESEDEDDEEE